MLEDLDSKNGTHRNGNPVVGQVFLQDGDTVQIALAQQFLFSSRTRLSTDRRGGSSQKAAAGDAFPESLG